MQRCQAAQNQLNSEHNMQPQQIHSKPPPPVPVPVSIPQPQPQPQTQNHEASKPIIPSSTTQNVNLVNLLKQNTVPVSILNQH